ncbi:MAG: OmpA family protein [Flavobacteriaceae bacterium]|nr:OmpA family protein [Flavobacteriaceae bacterium]
MKKIKIVLIIVICFIYSSLLAQNRSVAARYFKEYSYVKSAALYSEIVKKGDSSQITLERLADSYYNNIKFSEAKKWYAILFDKYKDKLANDYYYKYAQTLMASGETDLSQVWFNNYAAIAKKDIRAKHILSGLALEENKEVTYKNVTNLSVNTPYSDFNGFVSENKLAVFSTRPLAKQGSKIYKWNQQPYLNIYLGNIDVNNQIGSLNSISQINTKYHEATLVITRDGKTMYFTRDNYLKRLGKDKENTTNLKLYKAVLVNDEWSDIKELPFNSDAYSIGHPTLSADEKTLYFISDMPGSIGGTDIFKVSLKENNNYGTPINLGAEINTEGMEMFPYVRDNTLYFSSNGRYGLGFLDIYKVDLNMLSGNKVYNLGSPINSNMDDFAFTLKDAKNGYFSSNRKGGKGDDDIYSFSTEKLVCKEAIAGVIYDKNSKLPINLAVVKLIDESGKVIETITTKNQGTYLFLAKDCTRKFTVRADKRDCQGDVKTITLQNKNGETRILDLFLSPIITEVELVINPIYFDLDNHNIRPDAQYELEKIVTVLKGNQTMIIKIESHTDSRANDAYNKILSDHRAKATQDFFYSRGIAENRIQSAVGYGESRLLNKCANEVPCTKAEHQQNRRSKFIIVKL